MSIRALMRELVDEFATNGVTTSPLALDAEFVNRHPDAWDQYRDQLGHQGLRSIAREALTRDAKDNQQAFEGMELPRWFAVIDGEGGYVHVPIIAATIATYDAYIEGVLDANVRAAASELRTHRANFRRLTSVDGVDRDTLVLDALQLLEQVP